MCMVLPLAFLLINEGTLLVQPGAGGLSSVWAV